MREWLLDSSSHLAAVAGASDATRSRWPDDARLGTAVDRPAMQPTVAATEATVRPWNAVGPVPSPPPGSPCPHPYPYPYPPSGPASGARDVGMPRSQSAAKIVCGLPDGAGGHGENGAPDASSWSPLGLLTPGNDFGGLRVGTLDEPTQFEQAEYKLCVGDEFQNASHAPPPRPSVEKAYNSYLVQAPAWRTESVKFVVYCVLWYSSSALSNNIGKQILIQFRYPVTLTFVQFGFVATMCFLCSLDPKPRGRSAHSPSASPSVGQRRKPQQYSPVEILRSALPTSTLHRPSAAVLATILPLALFQIAGHVFTSVAISRVPVSFVHTIKALSPLFTVLIYRTLYRVAYSSGVWISLFPLTMGVMLVCSLEFNVDPLGLVSALVSCVIFVSQNIFSKKLLFNAYAKPVSADVVGSSETGGGVDASNGAGSSDKYGDNQGCGRQHALSGFGSSSSSSLSSAASGAYTNVNDRIGRTFHFSGSGQSPPSSPGSDVTVVGNGCYDLPHHKSAGSRAATATSLASFSSETALAASGPSPRHMDKMSLLFYSSLMAFVIMSPLWMYSDGLAFGLPGRDARAEMGASQPGATAAASSSADGNAAQARSARLVALICLNGAAHFLQSYFAFSLLSVVSPVTYSIASLVKRIFVILASVVYFRQEVQPLQAVGIALTFTGLWMYHSAKRAGGTGGDVSNRDAAIAACAGKTVRRRSIALRRIV